MKFAHTMFLILAVILFPVGLLLLPHVAQSIGGWVLRLAAFRESDQYQLIRGYL